ncbi:MAG: COG4705 family protein [Marmoricola sp.]
MADRRFPAPKVPEVFALFWIVKLLTTGIGEAGADYLGTVNLVLAGVVGVGGFAAALWLQLRAETYHPVRYWVTVLMVALFGTMIADGPHVALGTPYFVDAGIYLLLLLGLLARWYQQEGTLSVHSITTARRERYYWGTVLLTFGLGTALGDATAISLGMGFLGSIVLFGIAILVPFGLWRLGAAATGMFWASYALTRPLGASVADWLGKPAANGGLAWGDGTVFGLGLVLFAGLVAWLTITHRDREGAHAAARRPAVRGAAGDRDEPRSGSYL